MAPLEVLSAADVARQQEDESLPAMTMPSKSTDLWRSGFSLLLGRFMAESSSDLSLNVALASPMCTSHMSKKGDFSARLSERSK